MTNSSNTIPISVKRDFLERLSSTSSTNALAELIWNGLDAGSDHVDVHLVQNDLGGIEEIHVEDNGTGIPHDEVTTLFGNLGESWKKNRGRVKERSLHGKNGQGRLKAFALGKYVTWDTTFESGGTCHAYQIRGSAIALDAFSYTATKPAEIGDTGTKVVVTGIEKSHGALISEEAHQELAKLFAPYMSQYPAVRINLNGVLVDPSVMRAGKHETTLAPIVLSNGTTVEAKVSIIEWNIKTRRAIHLCDEDGVSLHELEPGIQAPGFNFTAYVKCDYFRELDGKNELILEELHPDVDAILAAGKEAVRSHFRKRAAEKHRRIVEQWKEERIYPYVHKDKLTPVEEAERQVFDILGVNLEAYLPKFEEADQSARKFTFRLLAQALRDNPESVQKIITEVLSLKEEDQKDLAALLSHTPLSNIISSAKTVANRLDFLVALENLLFDKESKKTLLERDQLHKILETEAWIFDEGFALSGSEKRLEEVLQLHIGNLGKREDDEPVLREGGKQGRVDLMLSRVTKPRHDERDHLVVELKRPSQKIDSIILGQVESYAIAVANDPRFHTDKTQWRFMVVSNEMDDHAKRKARQRDRMKGLVFDDAELNIQVWAFEWTEIIAAAKSRLHFINQSLCYEADRETAKHYLQKAHDRFIPPAQDN